jgi:hypothetical protein
VREQIERLERALESLSREVRPKSEQQFRVFAEGYVDQIAELRSEIDRYLGIAPLLPTPNSTGEAEGIIREVDLDENTFYLRDRGDGLEQLLCEYDELAEDQVKSSLGEPVRVIGYIRASGKSARRVIEVERIERLPRLLPTSARSA